MTQGRGIHYKKSIPFSQDWGWGWGWDKYHWT